MKKVKVLIGLIFIFLGLVAFSNESEAVFTINGNTFVYRLYNPKNGDHVYTTNVGEKNNLVSNNWRNEGSKGYFLNIDNTFAINSMVPVYRMYNSRTSRHMLTSNKGEYDSLHGGPSGWIKEGIAFYSHAKGTLSSMAYYRVYNPNQGSHVYVSYSESVGLVAAGWQRQNIEFYIKSM